MGSPSHGPLAGARSVQGGSLRLIACGEFLLRVEKSESSQFSTFLVGLWAIWMRTAVREQAISPTRAGIPSALFPESLTVLRGMYQCFSSLAAVCGSFLRTLPSSQQGKGALPGALLNVPRARLPTPGVLRDA